MSEWVPQRGGPKAFSPKKGLVFAVNGARRPRSPLPPQKFPVHTPGSPPSPLLEEPPPPPLGIFSKTPPPPRRKGGWASGRGWGGGGARPHLPRKRAPFSAKTPFHWWQATLFCAHSEMAITCKVRVCRHCWPLELFPSVVCHAEEVASLLAFAPLQHLEDSDLVLQSDCQNAMPPESPSIKCLNQELDWETICTAPAVKLNNKVCVYVYQLSCTRLRVPPVALHVSRYTCRS